MQTVTNAIYTLYYILFKFFKDFTGVRGGIVG